MNLLKTEPYQDGNPRYIGMYNTSTEGPLKGGPELIFREPNALFQRLRKDCGEDITVKVRSEELPKELNNITWFSGRSQIELSELLEIIKQQTEQGYDIGLKD